MGLGTPILRRLRRLLIFGVGVCGLAVPLLAAACQSDATTAPTPPGHVLDFADATQAPRVGSPLTATTVPESAASATLAPESPTTPEPPAAGVAAVVARVIDGDTVELADGSRLRLIGVDTPETVAPGRPVDCYGPEASAFTRQLIEGATVYLEKDVSETDRFGRLLRYVYTADGVMVNELLVAEGYAQVSTYPPDVKYVDRFLTAQAQARENGLGLWGPVCQAPPEQPPAPTATPGPAAPPAAPSAGCDPHYPTVCISPYPPDLNCGDIPHKRFQVLQPDPHGFDRDKDGIGCES